MSAKDSKIKRIRIYHILLLFSVSCLYIAITSFTNNMAGSLISIIVSIILFVSGIRSRTIYLKSQANNDSPDIPDIQKNYPNDSLPNNKTTHTSATERHHVAGTAYRQKEIESLGIENDQYCLTKNEIIDIGLENERIYFYDFYPHNVNLVEEPDNEFDPNAIKVIIDDIHVGYIKSGSCSHIKKILSENRIASINAVISGGKYKLIYQEYDDENGKDVYKTESDKTNYSIILVITLK